MNGDYYTINLDAEKEKTIHFSSYFKGVRTIILETSDDCLIGNIDEIQVYDEYIYILDSKKAKSMFVFDLEGKFIRKIGKVGNGASEYIQVYDFTLDMLNNNIFLLDQGNRVHKYKFDGTYLHTITIPGDDFNISFIQFYNGRLFAAYMEWETSKDDYLILEIDPENEKILSRSLSIKYNKGWNESYFLKYGKFFLTPTHNPPRYNQMFMDYIVSLNGEIKPFIKLKSRYLITEKDIGDFRGKDGLRINLENISKSSKSYGVHCFIENENFIYFRLGGRAMFAVILDKKTKEVKLVDHLYNDLIFNNNPLVFIGQFAFSDLKGAYEIWDTQSSALSGFQHSLNNNDIVSDLDKLDQLLLIDAESNPVIFFYEFK